MEDIQNKLQDVRNPAAAMTVLLRELDLETDSESLISVSQETQGEFVALISVSQETQGECVALISVSQDTQGEGLLPCRF